MWFVPPPKKASESERGENKPWRAQGTLVLTSVRGGGGGGKDGGDAGSAPKPVFAPAGNDKSTPTEGE